MTVWQQYDERHNREHVVAQSRHGKILERPTDWDAWDRSWPRSTAPWARIDRLIVAGISAGKDDTAIRRAILRHLRHVQPCPSGIEILTSEGTYQRIATVRRRVAALAAAD